MAAAAETLTFAEHVHELRRRLMWSLLFVAIGAGIGYALHDKVLQVLQSPLNDSLYYTAPTGAFSFIIKVCVTFGLIVALPVVVYQIFAFFGPLLSSQKRRTIVGYVFMSVLLAGAGITFAYFVSLPAALHFLVNFGGETTDIQALITADEYFSFVLAYIAGFALLFQLPLVISFINKVTPLKPVQLLGGTRYVILGSFVAAAIITPTPDPLNQALMAGPIILLYFLSVIVVMLSNKLRGRHKVKTVVPSVPLSHLDEILADETSLDVPEARPVAIATPPRHPQPVAARASARPPRPMTPRRQPAMDMIVPRRTPVQPNMRPDTTQTATTKRIATKQPTVTTRPAIRMISDFVPAPE